MDRKSFNTIRLEMDERGIANLILNRAEKHNAMNAQMIAEITDAAALLAQNQAVRAVILRAEGKTFCAGGDLNWMRSQMDKSRDEKIVESSALAKMLRILDDMPQPLIGYVTGNAFGGGVGMMCVCDFVLAVEGAKFGLTETRLGLIPATIGPYVVRRLGEAKAREVFFTGTLFDAHEALRLGLVKSVLNPDVLSEALSAEISSILQCAPNAVRQAKALCLHLARDPNPDQLDYTANQLADCWERDETRDGIKAFFDKQKPAWVQS